MQGLNLNTQDALDKLKSAFMEAKNTSEATPDSTQQVSQPTQTTPQPITSGSVFAAVLNGLGVGLLLGVLLGLAVSPVVSGVIGTLSSILVVLLGLNDKHITTLKSLRIGSFGLFAVIGVLAGMYIRVSEPLAQSTTDLKDEYTKAGYTDDQALYYIALKKFDYVPVGWFGTSKKDTVAMAKTDKHDQSVLFSSEVNLDHCSTLNTAKNTFPPTEILYTFEAAGGIWKQLASSMPEDLPDQAYVDGLLGVRDTFCEFGNSGKLTVEGTEKLKKLSESSNVEEIKTALIQAGGSWQKILENTEQKIPPGHQASFYLTVIKILSNEQSN